MEIKNLASALVKAQSEMSGAKKDSNNPFFKSRYADLASVDAAIGPAAAKHGLGYVQISHDSERGACVETIIIHESGETLPCGKVTVPLGNKGNAQDYGSAMTYARRYSLSAAFGVCPEDDDGNAAAKAAEKTAAAEEKAKAKESVPKGEFVDLCTAMSDAATMEELDKAADNAAAAAKKYGDKEAAQSFKAKYIQASEMLKVAA